ncbi:hypothetical protein FRAHR75_1060004 [Frankia sp. Hr75.2]|nr:hypothetical protein FRAHR75_1060004 [Frankia sp. Hr75.2]
MVPPLPEDDVRDTTHAAAKACAAAYGAETPSREGVYRRFPQFTGGCV